MSLNLYFLKVTGERKINGENYLIAEYDKDFNITHNLNKMAEEAGVYEALWRPIENDWNQAKDIEPLLQKGFDLLKSDPERFRKFDSPNGWGTYDVFLPWVKEVLDYIKENPSDIIEVSK